ncbi:MAG: hypothetical protein ACRD4M_03255 [Candidatus Acidiferrales bacterium]
MNAILKIKAWLKSGHVSWITLIAVIVFISSVISDQVLHWRGVRGSQTYINDLFLAGMAGLLAGICMTWQARQMEIKRARERMILTVELNHQVRNAVTALANSTMIRDEAQRLQVMDEAINRVDRALAELTPARPEERQAREN